MGATATPTRSEQGPQPTGSARVTAARLDELAGLVTTISGEHEALEVENPATGKLLASVVGGAGGGAVQLRDPATGRSLGAPFGQINAASGVIWVTFSPDGRMLASADSVGTVRFWQVSALENPYRALCADVGALTRQEWKQYAPGEPQPSVCS